MYISSSNNDDNKYSSNNDENAQLNHGAVLLFHALSPPLKLSQFLICKRLTPTSAAQLLARHQGVLVVVALGCPLLQPMPTFSNGPLRTNWDCLGFHTRSHSHPRCDS